LEPQGSEKAPFANISAKKSVFIGSGDHEQDTREFLDWCKTYLTEDENAICSLACHRRFLREAKCKTLELNADQSVDALCRLVLKECQDPAVKPERP